MKKIVSIISLLLVFLIFVSPAVNATTLGTIISDGKGFISSSSRGSAVGASNLETNVKDLSGTIYNVLLSIGVIVAVVVGIVIGIQFVVGGVEQKAQMKNALIVYIGGCVVVFGAFGIWKLVVNILQTM